MSSRMGAEENAEVSNGRSHRGFEVLLFDLGGVLMDFAGFEELARLVPVVFDRSQIRDLWIHSPAVQRFERGEITLSGASRRQALSSVDAMVTPPATIKGHW